MAERFVRVDLSDTARDFRPIAVEPGVPLLDRSNANSKILFRWLGGLVAEPEWEGDSVNFFVRDDHGGRLEEAVCQPASDDDLKGPLKADVEALAARIESAKPETSTERGVRRIVRETFQNLTEDENRTDRDNYFFKYRDVLGRWRLVWCWGYQRVDIEPATTAVCTDPDCVLLFVRRPGQSANQYSLNYHQASKTGITNFSLFIVGIIGRDYPPKPPKNKQDDNEICDQRR